MKRPFCVLLLSLATLFWGCATPRERRARARRSAQAKLGHFPKADFVRKYGDPRQCRMTWTGETCEFNQRRGLKGDVSEVSEAISIDFDHDGYSTGADAAAGY